MKRWQSYRRPNFRSQLILSEFFASQTAIKKCLNTRVLTTLYYMRSYMLIGPFKCSQLRSRVRELGPLVLRSTNPLLPVPTLRFSVIKIQIYHSRRLKGEERDSKSRRKKARGSLSTVRAAAGFAELAQLRWSSLHCAQKIVSKKKKSTEQWRKEHSICTLLMIEETLISLAFTRGQPKLTKLSTKTSNRCPHRQRVTFQAGHAESTIPLNSENWEHELLIPQVQYYPPAPTNMKKHLRVTSDEEKLVSLLCEWVLIDHGFRDRTLHPAHPLAKKSLKQLLRDPHEHSQTCFLYFRGRGIHWWGRFSCAVNESWRKIQVQTLHCSQQLLQSSQNN